jgi:hypothetical protein
MVPIPFRRTLPPLDEREAGRRCRAKSHEYFAYLVTAAPIFLIRRGSDHGVRVGLWFVAARLLTLTMVTQLIGMAPT